MHIEGKALLFKGIDVQTKEQTSRFAQVPEGIGYRDAIEMLLDEARVQVTRALEKALTSGSHDHETLNRVARKALGQLVGNKTRQRPMIVPVIVTV